MPSHPPHARIFPEGYPRSRGPYFARPPSFQHEPTPPSPRAAPPPEYAPPRWYDHSRPREQPWQPPPPSIRGRIAHRFNEAEAAYQYPMRRRHMQPVTDANQEPWTVPKPKSSERKSNTVLIAGKRTSSDEASDEKTKKEGDSLSLLAKVSSSMAPPHKRKSSQQERQQRNEESEGEDPETKDERTSSPSNATPRISRPGNVSPIQPGNGMYGGPAITPYTMTQAAPVSVNIMPKPITPTGHPAKYPRFHARPPQHYNGTLYMEERGPRYYGPPPPQPRGVYSSGPPAMHPYYHPGSHGPPTPQLSNFPAGESWVSPKNERGYYSQNPAVVERNSFDSAENPATSAPPHEGDGYWQPPFPAVSPYHGRFDGTGPYLPPRWSHEGPAPWGYPRPLGPAHPHLEEHTLEGDRATMSRSFAPYTYVQQPRLESKTLLRKKFSWKNYPELERFLIENREEYLEHSSRNYTVAQKQYNNMLTERLLEVAEKAGYAFDQDEFNFVSIRDRIRCYYKSYVQTVRKRGLPHPGNARNSKKAKTASDNGGDNGDEGDSDDAIENNMENGDS
ncbi:hypothetical protein FisN_17Hh292 [Fistulifera solaris]|uniref:Uncharacterized protein n=1 Tax=Fistulifera solaris TaxID=1519565 RepID=A0A1Z5JH82_FISSO|nr:hypothetical protein FisN_17Hh292 [Fistulifera solaris]|eukprot:GAX13349.1 hypothetical protein FisN_17Hh292 [Fistulifera solaris]